MLKIVLMFVFYGVSVGASPLLFDSKGLQGIEVNSMGGDINISPSTSGNIEILIEKIKFEKHCELLTKKEGESLEIEIKKTWFFYSVRCLVNLEIRVPSYFNLDIESAQSNLTVNSIKGDIEVDLKAGQVNIKSTVYDLDVKIGNGSLKVESLRGDADIKMRSGSILLLYDQVPNEADLEVKGGAVDLKVIFPEKTKITTKIHPGKSIVENDFISTPQSLFDVSIYTESGSIKLNRGDLSKK